MDLDRVNRLLGSPNSQPAAAEGNLRETTKARILAAHSATGGNLSETARQLGGSRNTVYRAIGAVR